MSNSYTAKTFIDAIPGTGGIISAISRKVGCTWNTTKAWIDGYPTVKVAYENECEAMLDLAESAVLKNIRAGDTQDAKWYLSKKGKQRGYGDQATLEVNGGEPIKIKMVWGDAQMGQTE